jgi:hypothetical protein
MIKGMTSACEVTVTSSHVYSIIINHCDATCRNVGIVGGDFPPDNFHSLTFGCTNIIISRNKGIQMIEIR